MKTWIAAISLVSVLGPAPALAVTGDAAAGAQKAAVCGACHGVNGNNIINPEWPNLAGQHASYLAAQLALFKQGIRNNVIMAPNAMLLSEQDMADLAAYFSQQPLQGLEADPSLVAAGEKLYRNGDVARGLPACTACHGPEGKGNGPAQYPAVRAQHSLYAYNQLKAFASGERKPVANDMMQVVAAKLSDAEMRALASYLQGLR
ncbi:MAG: cytochrome c subfamily [Proteobacteria bacterium]|nr:cytochrome c subfamily [Pseudomonadota bacterium]